MHIIKPENAAIPGVLDWSGLEQRCFSAGLKLIVLGMSTSGRQLRKRDDIYYGIPPPPWLSSKPGTQSAVSRTKRTTSRSSAKTKIQPVTSIDNRPASGAATSAITNHSFYITAQVCTIALKDVIKLIWSLARVQSSLRLNATTMP